MWPGIFENSEKVNGHSDRKPTFYMSFIPDLFGNLMEYSAGELYELIFSSYYFPAYYILHAVFVCFNLRYTSPGKNFPWYRSFILGFLLTAGTRYVFGKLCNRLLREFEGRNEAFIAYGIVWACFNICPFDLIFKFAMRPSSKVIIKCLDAFAQAQNVVQLSFSGAMIFEQKPLKVITLNIFCMCIPIIVDVLDRLIFGQRRPPMLYSFNYIKRMIVACIIIVVLGTNVIEGLYMSTGRASLYASLVFVVLAALDYYMTGKPFGNADLLFPNFWTEIATYYPSTNKCT